MTRCHRVENVREIVQHFYISNIVLFGAYRVDSSDDLARADIFLIGIDLIIDGRFRRLGFRGYRNAAALHAQPPIATRIRHSLRKPRSS